MKNKTEFRQGSFETENVGRQGLRVMMGKRTVLVDKETLGRHFYGLFSQIPTDPPWLVQDFEVNRRGPRPCLHRVPDNRKPTKSYVVNQDKLPGVYNLVVEERGF